MHACLRLCAKTPGSNFACTHLLHVYGDVELLQHVPNEACCEDETWVHGAAYHPAQGIPSEAVEEVPGVVKALLSQELRDAVVKPGVKLVDHALILDHREKPDLQESRMVIIGQTIAWKGRQTSDDPVVCI